MKDFLSNVWVKRAVSVFNVAYFAVITLLTYATFLYDLEFAAGREKSFFTVYVVLNVVFMGLMLFSRRELVTEILSILMLPVVFCMILFNMGDWILIVPQKAVKKLDGRNYVNLLVDGVKIEQDVELGIEDNDNVEILSGLSGGEEIILN